AQEVAQYCATSCALLYRPIGIWPVAMYSQVYPQMSAQLLAQLALFSHGVSGHVLPKKRAAHGRPDLE
ncbi:hypothetical protein, partial [Pseudomonas lundensis]|uniref:hypothetical protein n=1 Tax=Pseudomonas lundensis TaxID=86185 RepID=UPI00241E7B2A